MGGGAPRELSKTFTKRNLNPEYKKRLAVALDKLDSLCPAFKQSREDEAYSQLQKAWMDVNIILVEHLREVGHVMLEELQLALETGSDGGGVSATPWCEEATLSIPRLEFKLVDGKVHAVCDGATLARGPVTRDLPYEWVEKVVVKWVLHAVKQKAAEKPG